MMNVGWSWSMFLISGGEEMLNKMYYCSAFSWDKHTRVLIIFSAISCDHKSAANHNSVTFQLLWNYESKQVRRHAGIYSSALAGGPLCV